MGDVQDRRKNGDLEKARKEKSVIIFYCEGIVEATLGQMMGKGEYGGEGKEQSLGDGDKKEEKMRLCLWHQ